MKETAYITIKDLVPPNFLKKPKTIIVEAANGMGKTYSSVEYAVMLQKLKYFDRIYILEYSHKNIENVCNKIVKLKGWCIWYYGFEKYCLFAQKYKFLTELGVPLSYVCSTCPFFKNKTKIAFNVFSSQLNDPEKSTIKPILYTYGLKSKDKVCTHQILRKFALDVNFEQKTNLKIDETPILVVPAQLFSNHNIIENWNNFRSRQRKHKRILLIIDEADLFFYQGLKIEIKELSFSDQDYEILNKFSSKKRNLTRLINIYKEIFDVLEKINKTEDYSNKENIEKLKKLLKRSEPYLKSFDRKKRKIVEYVLENQIKTNVFKLKMSLDQLRHIENLEYTIKTIEKDENTLYLYDYDYAIRLLFDRAFPVKYVWKIVLSATFPSLSILKSKYLSSKAKEFLYKVDKRTKTYKNVYTYEVKIFNEDISLLNRNKEIANSIAGLLKSIKKVFDVYKQKFNTEPQGLIVWVCNKKQLSIVKKKLTEFKIGFEDKKKYIIMKYKKKQILISYLGGEIARGIDLDQYDISIGIGPLLRPPRHMSLLDFIDYAHGVSELVQAIMRIVRSPNPSRPKVVVLESHLLSPFYSQFFPDWFLKLFSENFIKDIPLT